jgi:CCR4-Not complex, Not1 subunit, domain of unknown function DUF3819
MKSPDDTFQIILLVVERSAIIAWILTRELVAKDFALEQDEEKMRKAAHLMVQYLSGSCHMQGAASQKYGHSRPSPFD